MMRSDPLASSLFASASLSFRLRSLATSFGRLLRALSFFLGHLSVTACRRTLGLLHALDGSGRERSNESRSSSWVKVRLMSSMPCMMRWRVKLSISKVSWAFGAVTVSSSSSMVIDGLRVFANGVE